MSIVPNSDQVFTEEKARELGAYYLTEAERVYAFDVLAEALAKVASGHLSLAKTLIRNILLDDCAVVPEETREAFAYCLCEAYAYLTVSIQRAADRILGTPALTPLPYPFTGDQGVTDK